MLDLQSYVRESSNDLKLKDFRKVIKDQQLEAHSKRGAWRTWPKFNLDNFIEQEGLRKSERPLCIGYYSPRQDWDEPQDLPESKLSGVIKCFPRCTAQDMAFHSSTSSQLQFNRDFGVWEPPSYAPEVTPDLVFIPCFASDMQGRRLGRGGGFYDKFLTRNPNIAHIGILHSDYVFDHLPERFFHSGDQRISTLLTNSNFFFNLKEQL